MLGSAKIEDLVRANNIGRCSKGYIDLWQYSVKGQKIEKNLSWTFLMNVI